MKDEDSAEASIERRNDIICGPTTVDRQNLVLCSTALVQYGREYSPLNHSVRLGSGLVVQAHLADVPSAAM